MDNVVNFLIVVGFGLLVMAPLFGFYALHIWLTEKIASKIHISDNIGPEKTDK